MRTRRAGCRLPMCQLGQEALSYPSCFEQRRAVAQLGSALHWGCRGRRFKSCQPDKYPHLSEPFEHRSGGSRAIYVQQASRLTSRKVCRNGTTEFHDLSPIGSHEPLSRLVQLHGSLRRRWRRAARPRDRGGPGRDSVQSSEAKPDDDQESCSPGLPPDVQPLHRLQQPRGVVRNNSVLWRHRAVV